jgi:hypothetical protein
VKDDAEREQEINAMLPMIAHEWCGVDLLWLHHPQSRRRAGTLRLQRMLGGSETQRGRPCH